MKKKINNKKIFVILFFFILFVNFFFITIKKKYFYPESIILIKILDPGCITDEVNIAEKKKFVCEYYLQYLSRIDIFQFYLEQNLGLLKKYPELKLVNEKFNIYKIYSSNNVSIEEVKFFFLRDLNNKLQIRQDLYKKNYNVTLQYHEELIKNLEKNILTLIAKNSQDILFKTKLENLVSLYISAEKDKYSFILKEQLFQKKYSSVEIFEEVIVVEKKNITFELYIIKQLIFFNIALLIFVLLIISFIKHKLRTLT